MSPRSLREKGDPHVPFLLVRPSRLRGKDDAMKRGTGALPGTTERQLFDAPTRVGILYLGRRQIERRETVEWAEQGREFFQQLFV